MKRGGREGKTKRQRGKRDSRGGVGDKKETQSHKEEEAGRQTQRQRDRKEAKEESKHERVHKEGETKRKH